MAVTMTGELGPTRLVGKAIIAGLGEADWSAKRAAVAAIVERRMSWRVQLAHLRRCWRCSPRPRVAAGAELAIKLATVVPDGSIWDKSLKQMAADWKQATADRVAVTVFSGGTQGDEPTRAAQDAARRAAGRVAHRRRARAASIRPSTSSTSRSSSSRTTS